MTIANALKEFFLKLNGTKPAGNNISEVIRNGAAAVELNNEVAQAAIVSDLVTRMTAIESANGLNYETVDDKSFILNSSTADSTKRFRISVVDDGTISATEIDS